VNDVAVPIHVEEQDGFGRAAEAVRIGVPLPRGLARDGAELIVVDGAHRELPTQTAVLARWPDRSIKWLLVDFVLGVGAAERSTVHVRRTRRAGSTAGPLAAVASDDGVSVDTGVARFQIRKTHPGLFASVSVADTTLVDGDGATVRLTTTDGSVLDLVAERVSIVEAGPVRARISAEGRFGSRGATPLGFTATIDFVAGSAAVRLAFRLENPQPAIHAGGTWDLGDPGSVRFSDLTMRIALRLPAQRIHAYAEDPRSEREWAVEDWRLYQDSSGGDQWNSPNHVDAAARPTVAFRGYRVSEGSRLVAEGDRATPGLTAFAGDAWIAAGVRDFWQNFPKALRWRRNAVEIALFPREAVGAFELQGGERKRHTLFLDFGVHPARPAIHELQWPVVAWVDPAWAEASRAIPWFVAASPENDPVQAAYVGAIVDGPHAFAAKREIADEYGWRNFGDLYADHEAVRHTGPEPFVSHYNNQYDFVYGACVHFLATGDVRWRQLLDAAAAHSIDIDIYHTDGDKPAFNHGLFWHTDHYTRAATCTHRTYSRRNGRRGYGGGPSNEHNYTSGYLQYFYLTGDPDAAAAVRELADWVLALDDGAQTVLGAIDSGPSGAATRTVEAAYHGPGRGAGNSINALLDAYALTRDRRYAAKAEELIERCVHPADDITALGLDQPEQRWSYLAFLQVLGKYLTHKIEWGEADYHYHYAREALLHYARWMDAHEVPYKDVLDRVEIPTETWPAQDIRKSHVLLMAADYTDGEERARFRARGRFFFKRCLADLLGFTTAYLTRPMVILAVYGHTYDYFVKYAALTVATDHNYAFGSPARFVGQRDRLRAALALRARVGAAEFRRIASDLLHRIRRRLA